VVGGLRAAANFADLFGEADKALVYNNAANEIVDAMAKHLYSRELGRFTRGIQFHGDDRSEPDATIDASLFGTFYFGAFAVDDPMVEGTVKAIEENLSVGGGIARFQNDAYMRTSDSSIGNAWFICTLWLAEYHIAAARTVDDLTRALEVLNWVVRSALPSGVLAEQIEPATGQHVSVSPLTWSHSTFVATVMNYIKAFGS
jgi:GH15 family glucan-1,4-alpha-glucosidase